MDQHRKEWRKSGELTFAAAFFVLSAILLAFLPDQALWAKKTRFAAQPAFWPGVSLIGMTLFAGLHLRSRYRREDLKRERRELRLWLGSLEYALWFMGYVLLVPIIGYLAATLAFAPVLAFRAGYRRARTLWLAACVGLGTVILFKTFLGVKIPGGAVYEYLPTALRSFMIQYF